MTRPIVCCAAACLGLAPQPASQPSPESQPGRPTAYAEGIRILWTEGVVELDASVCLRQGSLELFGCSPKTKTHESIVVIHGRPRSIYEALGLVGLRPGAPASYDPATDRSTPARGDALHIEVVTTVEGRKITCGLHEWMRMTKDRKPAPPLEWVFAGSRMLENDIFAADSEGTLICVVDFDTALIALPQSHTSDDEELWLEANTERIPPRGTKCVVRISAAGRGTAPAPATKPGL